MGTALGFLGKGLGLGFSFIVVPMVVFMGLVAVVFLGIAAIKDFDEKIYWGTFTTEYTQRESGGRFAADNVSYGTRVSDDGTITKRNIAFEGAYDLEDGEYRAAFQPDGLINDTENNKVHAHASRWNNVSLAVIVGLMVIFSGVGLGIRRRRRRRRGPRPRRFG